MPKNVLNEHPICPICAHTNPEGNIESASKEIIPEDFFCCQMPSCFHYNLRKPNQTQIFASQMVNIESLRLVLIKQHITYSLQVADTSHLVKIVSKPVKSNERYDGFCQFPVIVAKSSDPDDVKESFYNDFLSLNQCHSLKNPPKLEFQYCAPLEAESNLYRIINQEQTKLTMSLLKGKSITNSLHFRWFN